MNETARAYRLGAHSRRSADGRVIVGGRPPRAVRLSASGSAALDAVLAGRAAPHAARLVERLVAHGMLDPVAAGTDAEVSFVVPMRDGGSAITALVAALRAYGPVIVVDDGSTDGSPTLARRAGASVVPNAFAAGPGGARNTGLQLARGEFVAFVDADCQIDSDWARPLAALLQADDELALAAPRVRGVEGDGRLERWERLRSPLDMGTAGGFVGPGRQVSFVPSAALVARRASLLRLGGFDDTLRFGEDVDLIWRAVADGWSVRYAPEVEVRHPARRTLRARARQHFDYGTSAAALELRHPGAATPLRPNRMMLPACLSAAGSKGGGLLAAAGLVALPASRQADVGARRLVALLALEAQLTSVRELARAAGREWLPLSAVAVATGGRARRLALLLLATDLAAATAPAPSIANGLIHLADNLSYCAGLWSGALTRRSGRALMPSTRRTHASSTS